MAGGVRPGHVTASARHVRAPPRAGAAAAPFFPLMPACLHSGRTVLSCVLVWRRGGVRTQRGARAKGMLAPPGPSNEHLSVNKVLKHLKRRETGLFNCLASIAADAQFVAEIARLYPGLPLLANLRCGLWYTPQPDGTCYFKSTDGHAGNWGFSYTRLNLHVAHLATSHRGCLIVDATRRGKLFPVRP